MKFCPRCNTILFTSPYEEESYCPSCGYYNYLRTTNANVEIEKHLGEKKVESYLHRSIGTGKS